MSPLKLNELVVIEQNLLVKLSEINKILEPLNKEKVEAKRTFKRLGKRIDKINSKILDGILPKEKFNGVKNSDFNSYIYNNSEMHRE